MYFATDYTQAQSGSPSGSNGHYIATPFSSNPLVAGGVVTSRDFTVFGNSDANITDYEWGGFQFALLTNYGSPSGIPEGDSSTIELVLRIHDSSGNVKFTFNHVSVFTFHQYTPSTYSTNYSFSPASPILSSPQIYSLNSYYESPAVTSPAFLSASVIMPVFSFPIEPTDYLTATVNSVSNSNPSRLYAGNFAAYITLPELPLTKIVTTAPNDSSDSYIFNGGTSLPNQGRATPTPDDLNGISAYLWDLGDGASSTSATVTHEYADQTSKTLKLRATDNYGSFTEISNSFVPALVDRTIGAFSDPHGQYFSAVKESTGVRVSCFPDGTIASRQLRKLLPNASAPSLWQDNIGSGDDQECDSTIWLCAKDTTTNLWKLYASYDDGEEFTIMATTPFDSTYKVVSGSMGNGASGYLAVKGTAVSFARTYNNVDFDIFDNGTKITPVGDLGSASKSLTFHTEHAEGGSRLVAENGQTWRYISDDEGQTWIAS